LKIIRAGNENDRQLYHNALSFLKWYFGEPIEILGNRALFVDLPDRSLVKAPLNSEGEAENKAELQDSGGCLRSFEGIDVLLTPYTAWLSQDDTTAWAS
jgi:hypothetical protein